MPLDHPTTLHFQCSFELRPEASVTEPWTELAKSLRHWVSEAPRSGPPNTNPAFYAGWFYNGGEWRGGGGAYHFVKTQRLVADGTDREPQHWAMRYEHNCEVPGRVWRIDAGVTRLADRKYRLSLVIAYYLRDGFIGREPIAPLPTAPRIVAWFLQSEKWQAFAGTEQLRLKPVTLCAGDGESLRRRLEDPGRECPIVVASRDYRTGQPTIDALRLAKLLSGSSVVYESESSELDKELEWTLGARFSCWNGMVRVYQPGLRFNDPAAPKRQRYFSGRDIAQHGHDAVLDMLVHGVARRAQKRPQGVVSSIDDVVAFERDARMLALKTAASEGDRDEWVELLEATNAELESEKKNLEATIEGLRADVADQADRISRLEADKKSIVAQTSQAAKEARTLKQRAEIVAGLTTLPGSMLDVIVLIERVHPERIVFTDRAKKSVESCGFTSVGDAWRCFWHMATLLHDLFFVEGEKPGNIEQAFYDSTGFYLAMTEGKLTKKDSKLMASRSDTLDGRDIDITPHVKLDKDTTRAYFCPLTHGSSKRIVVGYIGHLDTAGTRRRSK
jgi:hypothetical protein